MGPTGPSGKNPSTAASSNTQQPSDDIYNSRGFGELGSTKKKGELQAQLAKDRSESNLNHYDASSSDEEPKLDKKEEGESANTTCPNCQEVISREEAGAHTVMCYRNSTKCKVCRQVILKAKKKEHLIMWRDPAGLQEAICQDHEE